MAELTAKAIFDKTKAELTSSNGHKNPAPVVPPSLVDLFEQEDPTHDWIITGLLERGDRLILTGKEGFGKSTFYRQISVAAAIGVNPITFKTLPKPLTIFLVDLENSTKQLRREFPKIMQVLTAEERADFMPRYYFESRVEGMVLDDVKDKVGDRAWLEARIAGCNPDILVIGPLYKMMEHDPMDEVPSRNLAKWLDTLRVKYKVAVALEAHGTHQEKRVYGWVGWKRWPECGLHLDEEGNLTRWRGDREERIWPNHLRRGGEGEWLWVADAKTTAPPSEVPLTKATLVRAFFEKQFEDAVELPGDKLMLLAYNTLGASKSLCQEVATEMGIEKAGGVWKYHGELSSPEPCP